MMCSVLHREMDSGKLYLKKSRGEEEKVGEKKADGGK